MLPGRGLGAGQRLEGRAGQHLAGRGRRYAVADDVDVAVLQLQQLDLRVHSPAVLDGVEIREPGIEVVGIALEHRRLGGGVVRGDLERPVADRRLAPRLPEPGDFLTGHRRGDRLGERVEDGEVGRGQVHDQRAVALDLDPFQQLGLARADRAGADDRRQVAGPPGLGLGIQRALPPVLEVRGHDLPAVVELDVGPDRERQRLAVLADDRRAGGQVRHRAAELVVVGHQRAEEDQLGQAVPGGQVLADGGIEGVRRVDPGDLDRAAAPAAGHRLRPGHVLGDPDAGLAGRGRAGWRRRAGREQRPGRAHRADGAGRPGQPQEPAPVEGGGAVRRMGRGRLRWVMVPSPPRRCGRCPGGRPRTGRRRRSALPSGPDSRP